MKIGNIVKVKPNYHTEKRTGKIYEVCECGCGAVHVDFGPEKIDKYWFYPENLILEIKKKRIG